MLLSEVKSTLENIDTLQFQLPNGDIVPSHFHVTEVGQVSRRFIDCGGTMREENKINFQLFIANDIDHQLQAKKFKKIIELSERKLELGDLEINVEYQGDTIENYALSFENGKFQLQSTFTDCLAKDNCGIPAAITKSFDLTHLAAKTENSCSPGSGCC